MFPKGQILFKYSERESKIHGSTRRSIAKFRKCSLVTYAFGRTGGKKTFRNLGVSTGMSTFRRGSWITLFELVPWAIFSGRWWSETTRNFPTNTQASIRSWKCVRKNRVARTNQMSTARWKFWNESGLNVVECKDLLTRTSNLKLCGKTFGKMKTSSRAPEIQTATKWSWRCPERNAMFLRKPRNAPDSKSAIKTTQKCSRENWRVKIRKFVNTSWSEVKLAIFAEWTMRLNFMKCPSRSNQQRNNRKIREFSNARARRSRLRSRA